MGASYSVRIGNIRIYYKIYVAKPKANRSFTSPWCRKENNIKTDLPVRKHCWSAEGLTACQERRFMELTVSLIQITEITIMILVNNYICFKIPSS
jgi:hypothetical protein